MDTNANDDHHGDRLLTDEEVADRLGISVKKAASLISRKMLPVVRVFGRNRVRESDLDAFIANRPIVERSTPAKKRVIEEPTRHD